ncbi:cytochrome P450 [Ktedonosporobacter rubrisoli]|uniref:Cytochrome P450 n=1 Tax=Ktedonosporobacter rubrisoli TaxID=2509675 RepID=A0A4P6JTF1_KTERU|nr:cytochrome P450 [Ktedonosporobacter rubrisoli]QBD78570.1 cytochrome P450 [Ktedonosporobacter rubrisoli]
MTQTATEQGKVFARILDPASRANPYPLYARLRETPISRQDDGTYVVSTYQEIAALLHDPRISSDERKSSKEAGALAASGKLTPAGQPSNPPFIFLDPPEHDRLRRLVIQQFTPERVEGMREHVVELVNHLLDAKKNSQQIDIVDDLAYPLPVTVICDMLGVPREDEPRFHKWATLLARSLDPAQGISEAELKQTIQAATEIGEYMNGLIEARQKEPRDDMLSGLLASYRQAGRGERDLLVTMTLLLVAGHETTVNLITNGTLTLLRHPEVLEQLRREPDLVIRVVEELLRFDPPVQFRTRTTLTDIPIAGVTIPKGAAVALLLASGSRDPRRFTDPERFDPRRSDNEHLGFGGAIHYCVGAPLARVETQVALSILAQRLLNPRMEVDPPPYRENASLRGPEHLLIRIDGIRDI